MAMWRLSFLHRKIGSPEHPAQSNVPHRRAWLLAARHYATPVCSAPSLGPPGDLRPHMSLSEVAPCGPAGSGVPLLRPIGPAAQHQCQGSLASATPTRVAKKCVVSAATTRSLAGRRRE
ncbi:hypothetical protein NDU88_004347 [Pleurodeles waltl]|uniref:Uncharacterized protein n=1 Tax=Pleurodeles waltl TaxID=8319 RepID=A0AAV7V0W6_PLEWA|nr:hypothetical protein NDU88_004347 [Pleurodeles waltl]